MADIQIYPATNPGPRGPDLFMAKDRCQLGSAWRATTREGTPFLYIVLDSPMFPRPVECKLFRIGQSSGHRLMWTERYDPGATAASLDDLAQVEHSPG